MWSYTKPSGDSGYLSGNLQFCWINSWTLAEQEPNPIGSILLKLTVSTSTYWEYPANWNNINTDTISCNGQTLTITPTQKAGQSYTRTIRVPNSWAGQTVSLDIAWTRLTVTLGASPSYNTPSTIEAADGLFGSPVPVSLNRSVTGVTHTLSVACAGRTERLLTDSADTALTWMPELAAYAALLPNADSAAAVFSCESFYNGASLGTAQRTVTLRLPESVAPTAEPGWFTLTPYNTDSAAALPGVYIQGHSRAEAAFDETKLAAPYGASITGYRLSDPGGAATSAPYRSGVLTGPTPLTLTAIDSRGRTVSETVTLTPASYYAPRLTQVRLFRSDSAGEPLESGTWYTACAGAEIASLEGQNSATLRLFLRSPGGAWSAGEAIPLNQAATRGEISPDQSYELKLELTDTLGTVAAATAAIPTQRWAMKFNARGTAVAFGKAPEHDKCLELPADWTLRQGDQILNRLPLGDAYLTTREGDPAELLGYGKWEAREAVGGLSVWVRVG